MGGILYVSLWTRCPFLHKTTTVRSDERERYINKLGLIDSLPSLSSACGTQVECTLRSLMFCIICVVLRSNIGILHCSGGRGVFCMMRLFFRELPFIAFFSIAQYFCVSCLPVVISFVSSLHYC